MRKGLRSWVQQIVRESVRDELVGQGQALDAAVESQHAIERRIGALADDTAARTDAHESQMAEALRMLAAALDQVSHQLERQGHQLHSHLGRTELLMRELAVGALTARPVDPVFERPTILGGTIDPAGAGPTDLDLRDGVEGALVEVWSHFQGAWSSGFRLLGMVEDEHGQRARVERISDHYELPMLFDPSEVRLAGDERARSLAGPVADPSTLRK